MNGVQVYWYDDRSIKGGCRVPESWQLEAYQDGQWVPVSATSGGFGTTINQFNKVSFDAITVSKLRLTVKLQDGFSGGILRWDCLNGDQLVGG